MEPDKSGDASMQLTVTTKEKPYDFPRSGSVSFTNSAGGCAVFSITQAGNGSSNTGALKITSPETGETMDYAKFRTYWDYDYWYAYFTTELYDVTSGKIVHSEDMTRLMYDDIPQSALAYGHVCRLTVAAYDDKYNKISESSIVLKVEGLNAGSSNTDSDDGVIDETDTPEGVNEIIYTGITDGEEIIRDDISVSWQNVIGADYYWVALRDMTLYPEGTPNADVKKVIDQEMNLLTVSILEGQLISTNTDVEF